VWLFTFSDERLYLNMHTLPDISDFTIRTLRSLNIQYKAGGFVWDSSTCLIIIIGYIADLQSLLKHQRNPKRILSTIDLLRYDTQQSK
jgi:hypothetical protein